MAWGRLNRALSGSFAAVVALVPLLVAGCGPAPQADSGEEGASEPAFPQVGAMALDFELQAIQTEEPHGEGPMVKLSDYRGQVVLVDVFGTWCGPCQQKYPKLAEIAREYEGRGVQFLGILFNDNPGRAVRWFAERGGMAYPFLSSEDEMTRAWGISGAPQGYLIDTEGRLIDRCFGCQEGTMSPDALPAVLDSLLALNEPG